MTSSLNYNTLNLFTQMFGSNMRLVPWRNKAEWLQVYQDAYSSDVNRQASACQIMEIWLVMRNDVPPGIECTVNLLSALMTFSHQNSSPRQSQLTLSTAVLRVINMLCDNARISERQTMFSIAKLYNLPEWIVILRHEVSHGQALPSLSALVLAAKFLLAWLKEMYWEVEREREDVVLQRSVEEACRENLQYYLNLYLDLMHLYITEGDPSTLSTDFRLRLKDLDRKRGFPVAIETMPWTRHAREAFSKEGALTGSGIKVSGVISNLLGQLQDYLPGKQARVWQVNSLPDLVNFMIQHSKQHKGIEREVWDPLLEKLNLWQLLDRVALELTSSGEEGHNWLAELIRAAVKRHRVEGLRTHLSVCHSLSTVEETSLAARTLCRRRLGLPTEASDRLVLTTLFRKVERKHPALRQALRLTGSVQYMVDSCSALEILRRMLASPDHHTLSLLDQLLILVNPELGVGRRLQLTDLLLVRLGEKTLGKLRADNSIRTLNNLSQTASAGSDKNSPFFPVTLDSAEPLEQQQQQEEIQSEFAFVRSGWDFTGCPLGVNPWELQGCQYYHVPFNPKVSDKQYIFPLSPHRWIPSLMLAQL